MAMMAVNGGKLVVTLVRSLNKRLANHQACVRGLGLKKIGDTRSFEQVTPAVMGMIKRVSYLLKVEGLE